MEDINSKFKAILNQEGLDGAEIPVSLQDMASVLDDINAASSLLAGILYCALSKNKEEFTFEELGLIKDFPNMLYALQRQCHHFMESLDLEGF